MTKDLIVIRDSKRYKASLTTYSDPDVCITLSFDDYHSGNVGGISYWHCLKNLHAQLDAANIKLLCNGCRYDVKPSGMSLSMTAGLKAYRLRLGRPASQEDIVSVFDPTDDIDAVGTVAQQEEFYARYLMEYHRSLQ